MAPESGMLDVAASCAGSYSAAVAKISATLEDEAAKRAAPLRVSVVGRGGRDTNCSLAVVEAAARCKAPVAVKVLTCSWPDDTWEPVLADYLASLQKSGDCAKAEVDLEVLKFGEEPEELLRRLQAGLDTAHLIVQCEQGADLFVEPTSEWLQDNFEDWFVHACCLRQAEERGVPVYLLQTNADLDLARGIDAERVTRLLGSLQTEAFSTVALDFQQKEGQETPENPPRMFVDLCVQIGGAERKRDAFRTLLGIDLDGPVSAPGNFYTRYMIHAAQRTDAAIPVAGMLELAVALRKGGYALPWSCGELPDPRWVFARCLQEPGVAVLTETRSIGLDAAPTYAAFVGRWMSARHTQRRPRTNCVPAACRATGKFWSQLELAQRVASAVREKRPDFDLWAAGPDVVTKALEHMALALPTHEEPENDRAKIEQQAKAGQPSYGTLSPLFRLVQPHFVHVFDFALRLLGAPDADAEFKAIAAGLPQRPAAVSHGWRGGPELHAQLFADALLAGVVLA